MHPLWLVPAVPLALFGIGLGLMLCDIKPGLLLMAAAWLLCVPAAIYGSVRLAMTMQRAVEGVSYTAVCAKVIARFEGHIAQYLGDGLLVYFGYPLAHEDDAQRAVRAGLGMIEALGQLTTRLEQERGVHLAARLGIHTGLVVVGEVGGGTRQEQLALGETPNVAARLQGLAATNTLVISAATFQLLGGFFASQPLGTPLLKGLAQPLAVYRVFYESMARNRLEAASSTGWTPLVGREPEIRVLLERWAQVTDGLGQVVLLSGDAGIGKPQPGNYPSRAERIT